MSRTTIVADTVGDPAGLAQLPGVHDLHAQDGQVRLDVDGDQVQPVLRALADIGVRSLVAHPPTLEQLLMRHYGDDLAERDRVEQAALEAR